MKIADFYDLNAWKESHNLTLQIYKLTTKFPSSEKFGITDQLRRASSSISANIAEGFGRYHYKDKIKFYYQARGSIKEVQNFIFLAKDLGYLKEDKSKELWLITKDCERLINGLIKSANNQNR